MVVGFNHNFRYKGVIYHIQTEDSGLKNPHIVTLLYRGGTILASRKTSYADIIKVDGLKGVVEDLMKDQHRQMLRSLKDGEFDHLIRSAERKTHHGTAPSPQAAPAVRQAPPISRPPREAAAVPPKPGQVQQNAARKRSVPENSLDEVILSYLAGEEKDKR